MSEIKLILKGEDVQKYYDMVQKQKTLDGLVGAVQTLTVKFNAFQQRVEETMGQLKDQLLQQLSEAQAQVVDAESRLAALKAAEDQEDVQQNAERDSLQAQIAELQQKIADLEATAAQSLNPTEAQEVTDQITSLKNKLGELQSQLPEAPPSA